MSAAEVSEFLGVPVATIHSWRSRGVGPKAMKVGRHLRFRRETVEKWLDAKEGGRDGKANREGTRD